MLPQVSMNHFLRSPIRLASIGFAAIVFTSCSQAEKPSNDPEAPPLVAAARKQIGVTVTYDPAYVGLDYPNGDVPRERGVCTDVLIRAMRDALGADLQKLVHDDMKGHFAAYPNIWGLTRPDRNIDHRRVPNLRTFLKRRDCELGLDPDAPLDAETFKPGDIVTCTVPSNRPHIMIVSNQTTPDGRPKVIHHIGSGTKEEDALHKFPLTGHYRWK